MVDKRQAWKKDERMQYEMTKRGKKKDDRMPALKKDDTTMAGTKDKRFVEFWKIFSVETRTDVKLSVFHSSPPGAEGETFIYCPFLFLVGTFWLIAVSDWDFLSPSSPRTLVAPLPSFRFGATFLSRFKLPFIGFRGSFPQNCHATIEDELRHTLNRPVPQTPALLVNKGSWFAPVSGRGG